MPYIRTRGNQLLLVHGFRDEEKKVNQQVLFTIFSKPEAQEIMGKKKAKNPNYFKHLIEKKSPSLKFNWPKLNQAIEEQKHVLPDLYQYKNERTQKGFKKDLGSFLRQLVSADPQATLSAAQLYQDNHYELEFIIELIEARLFCSKDQKSNSFNGDNRFYWRQSLQKSEPYELEEMAERYMREGDNERAKAIFNLLTETFEDYAEGFNYLGLIALEEGEIEDAAQYFKQTVETGRRKFPKKMAKSNYWNDHDTRPYIRGLRNQSSVLNRLGKFDEALELCEKLEKECGDDFVAASTSSDIYLNLELWSLALKKATYVNNIYKCQSFNAAFASMEMGDLKLARTYFLHAALNYPYTAHLFIGLKKRELKRYQSLTPEEQHDPEVSFDLEVNLSKYLKIHRKKIKHQLGNWLLEPGIQELIFDRAKAVNEWRENRQTSSRDAIKLMNKMGELQFSKKAVADLCGDECSD